MTGDLMVGMLYNLLLPLLLLTGELMSVSFILKHLTLTGMKFLMCPSPEIS